MDWLGEASFAVYVVHWPLLEVSLPGGAIGYAFAVLDAMALAHILVERPALAACMRLSRGFSPLLRIMPRRRNQRIGGRSGWRARWCCRW